MKTTNFESSVTKLLAFAAESCMRYNINSVHNHINSVHNHINTATNNSVSCD